MTGVLEFKADARGSARAGCAAQEAAPGGSSAGVMPGDGGYHLHSWKLSFDHPVTGQRITVTAPPPAALL